jgi:hypothetical protein
VQRLLPLAHLSLCLRGLQAHSYLRVQWRIVATVSTVLVFSVGLVGGAEGHPADRIHSMVRETHRRVELQKNKGHPVLSDPFLSRKNRPLRSEFYSQRDY